jgi:hypothetical protein
MRSQSWSVAREWWKHQRTMEHIEDRVLLAVPITRRPPLTGGLLCIPEQRCLLISPDPGTPPTRVGGVFLVLIARAGVAASSEATISPANIARRERVAVTETVVSATMVSTVIPHRFGALDVGVLRSEWGGQRARSHRRCTKGHGARGGAQQGHCLGHVRFRISIKKSPITHRRIGIGVTVPAACRSGSLLTMMCACRARAKGSK